MLSCPDCCCKLLPNWAISAASSLSPFAAAFCDKAFICAWSWLLLDDDNCEDTCATESANELTVLVELIKLSTPLSNWLNPPLKLLAPLYAESIPLFILLYDWSNLFALLT